MKAKPKPKKKPFRITGPGLYRTRDGRVAAVGWDESHRWFGFLFCEEGLMTWPQSGSFWEAGGPSKYDLISRWPGKKARRK